MPGSVPGTFTIRFGRPICAHTSRARRIVPSASKARSASTSSEMKPSRPPSFSQTGRIMSQARVMSAAAARSKICCGVASAGAEAMSSSYRSDFSTAFAKMDGFDVPPVTLSSVISFASSPESSAGRATLSYQTLWPKSRSAFHLLVICISPLPRGQARRHPESTFRRRVCQ